MLQGPSVATIGALIGNPARANILASLLDGRALTAGELAWAAGVSPQTTSAHLAQLTEARLLAREKQGRHRYFRLASAAVAEMLESIMVVAAADAPAAGPKWRGGEALREARTCYDHLAGRLAVGLAEALVVRRRVVLCEDGGQVTTAGARFLEDFGIDLASARNRRRAWCRPCLDWSERRPHLAGALGAALADRCFELHWVRRLPDTRAVEVTDAGRRGIAEVFGFTFLWPASTGSLLVV
ncbi:MAG TPA: metalloregulator ArsR/SmtB family transcription factor [Caulobacteraceae bacterium]|nr:metalloregulator ArsR/SmtB family transcription factor [Caulobacteraceae bacterium]